MHPCKYTSTTVILFLFVCFSEGLASSQNDGTLFDKSGATSPPEYPPFKGCEMDSSKPLISNKISSYKINLDIAPRKRWSNVVKVFRKEIVDLIETIKLNAADLFGTKLIQLIEVYMPYLAKTLPTEYYEEMVGISEGTGMQLGEIVLFNVFYEFFTVCTSIIVESPNGDIYHGRNLDFGLFMGWNVQNKTWLTTEYLRPLVVKLAFQKNGKTLYNTVNFAGYIGVLTGVKQGSFSLTVNERFRLNGGYIGIAEWIFGFRHQKWLGLLTREVMENADSYASALKWLSTPKLVAPVYFVLSGIKSHQGCIITRGRDSFDIWTLGQRRNDQNATWYQVQTNYDHWKEPPFYDNRQSPAEYCMEKIGPEDPGRTLQDVLSTRPILNKLTVYSAIMQASTGMLNVWLQVCTDPCWPW